MKANIASSVWSKCHRTSPNVKTGQQIIPMNTRISNIALRVKKTEASPLNRPFTCLFDYEVQIFFVHI